MKDIIYEPEYRTRYGLSLIILPIFGLILLFIFFYVDEPDPILIGFAIFIGCTIIPTYLMLVRRITFNEDGFIVDRFLGFPKKVDYSEVVLVGPTFIQTGKRKIGFPMVENLDELHRITRGLAKQGKLRRETIRITKYDQDRGVP